MPVEATRIFNMMRNLIQQGFFGTPLMLHRLLPQVVFSGCYVCVCIYIYICYAYVHIYIYIYVLCIMYYYVISHYITLYYIIVCHGRSAICYSLM